MIFIGFIAICMVNYPKYFNIEIIKEDAERKIRLLDKHQRLTQKQQNENIV